MTTNLKSQLKKKIKTKSSIQKPSKKKKNRRSLNKYSALDPKLNLKSRSDLLDYDYLNKLNEKELAWLNKFTEEYVHASLDTKNVKNNLHNTKKLRKECYDRNNARNRDVLTRNKFNSKLAEIETIKNIGYSEEDKINSIIDFNIDYQKDKRKKVI